MNFYGVHVALLVASNEVTACHQIIIFPKEVASNVALHHTFVGDIFRKQYKQYQFMHNMLMKMPNMGNSFVYFRHSSV